MSRSKRILIIVLVLTILSVFGVQQGINMVKDGARAYLFGYPLVLMDATRDSLTDPETGRAPVNHFAHVQTFPDHNFRKVVRPNNDTLYSNAWLDLTAEPLVLTVPDTAGRYYVMPFMDAWTNVFDSVGLRTTGSGAGHYIIAGPDWKGEAPPGLKIIRSPTNMSWLIGRIQTNGLDDFPNVHKLQEQFFLTPLSRWADRKANKGYIVSHDESSGTSDNPSAKVEQMSAGEFFDRVSRLMGKQPPAKADAPMIETLAKFGIKPGEPFDIEKLGFIRKLILKKAVDITRQKLVDMTNQDRSSENNWAVIREGIGIYGANYEVRSFVSLIGLGALTPKEAAYPNSIKDKDGDPLSGKHKYRIHFEAGKTPPVHAFWSLTMYDPKGFLIDNPIKKYTIGDRDELNYNTDGSLDILIQHQKPADNKANWLPAPADDFAVTMRLYMPKEEFLDGTWKLPFIEKTGG